MTIEELLTEYNVPTAPEGHHHVTRGWVGFDCPYCSSNSKRYRMGIHLTRYYCSCWICGYHKLIPTLAEITGELPRILKGLLDWTDWTQIKADKPTGKLTLPRCIGPLLPLHRNYLKKRGFDPDYISKLWGVKGIGLAVELPWRLYIPIHFGGEVMSWTTRSITNSGATRYITARSDQETIPAKSILYGVDHARHGIVVCEGPLDVWKIGPGAVATLGMNYSQEQLLEMSKFPLRAICFDSELEAQKRAKKLCNDLAVFPGVTKNIILKEKDPAAANDRTILKIRETFLEQR